MLRFRIRRDELWSGGSGATEGAYGCVTHQPVATCSYDRRRRSNASRRATGYIYKLFARKADYEKELAAIDRIAGVLTPAETPAFIGNCAVTLPANVDLDLKPTCPEMVRRGVFAPGATAYQIVYEYGGRSLLAALSGEAGPFKTLWFSLAGVFRGLLAMDRAGLVHADVKPDNVLYDEDRALSRLIDFGLTVPRDELFDGPAIDLAQSSVSMSTPPEWIAARMADYSDEAVAAVYAQNMEVYGRRVMDWLHPDLRRSRANGRPSTVARAIQRATQARIQSEHRWTDSVWGLVAGAAAAPAFWRARPEVYDVYGMGLLLAEITVMRGPAALKTHPAFAATVRRACACLPQDRCTLEELHAAYEATAAIV